MISGRVDSRGAIVPRGKDHAHEFWAVICLMLGPVVASIALVEGGFTGVAHWIAISGIGLGPGWMLTYRSRRWTKFQKWLAATAIPIPLGVGAGTLVYTFIHFSMENNDAEKASPWEVALVWTGFLMLFIIPVVVSIYLSLAVGRAAQAEADTALTLRRQY